MTRPARTEDVPALVALERCAMGADAWGVGAVTEEVHHVRRTVLVAGAEEPVGYAVVDVVADVADLLRVVVDPAHRRAGHASALVEEGLQVARRAGATRMLLEVAEANRAARALYRALGFREVARRRSYYAGGGDALVLEVRT